jgi:hypothetical protein
MKKPTVEYQWEAYYPDAGEYHPGNGEVFKRGPIRDDIDKVTRYVNDLRREIADLELPKHPDSKRHLASYWRGAAIRVVTRTISPWTEIAEITEVDDCEA